MVVWFTSLCLMPSHSRGLLVWESKIMATSPFFVVLVLFLIILHFGQYPSKTMVRVQLDSKGPILTIKCGKDHCVVLEARHFSRLASLYSRLGFTKPRFTNLGFDTQRGRVWSGWGTGMPSWYVLCLWKLKISPRSIWATWHICNMNFLSLSNLLSSQMVTRFKDLVTNIDESEISSLLF